MASPSSIPSDRGRETDIEHEAAAWLARRDRGLSAAEQDEFFQWLAADPRHGDWLAQHQQTVKGLKLLAQWRPEHGARPNPDLLAHPPSPGPARSHRRSWIAAGWAAAAAIAVAFILGGPRLSSPSETGVGLPTSSPVLAAETTPVLRRLLEDGSWIDLNRGAEVEVMFTAEERRVRLVRGEAHFTVAKNLQRPFIVQANRVSIRAVGTAFDVRLQPASVEVLVTEGRVSVDPAAAAAAPAASGGPAPLAALVTMGERALVSLTEPGAAPKIDTVPAGEIARLLAWQPRELEFVDAPLAQVVAEFNRDNRVKLVVADPLLAALPIGATLRSDNVEGFVRLLETSFQVAVERRPDGVIVLRRRTPDEPR